MSGNQFIPRLNNSADKKSETVETKVTKTDPVGIMLHRISQVIVVSLFGLIPLFFVPGLWATLGFSKVFLAIVASATVLILICFVALRKKDVRTVIPVTLGIYWLIVLAAFVSAFSSGDSTDAIRGSGFEVRTAGFLVVFGLVMTLTLVFQKSKRLTLAALSTFGLAAFLLLAYNVTRLFVGVDFLAVGSFRSLTMSPIGGFNDLAIFSGLLIVFSFITLLQLPVRAWLQYALATAIVLSLLLLSIINFPSIWIVVGSFSFLLLVYLLTRDSLFGSDSSKISPARSRILLSVTTITCLVSALFVTAGDYASKMVSDVVSVEYVQVVPSPSATLDIARAVYSENVVLGFGPNRFADAWRQYKDKSINNTIFWDTDFYAGSGHIPTFFVTLGLLGGSLFLLFHIWYLYLGYKMLLRSQHQDSYWYYLGSVSFATATFVWIMSYLYEPGVGILLIGALFTGMTFVAAGSLLPKMIRTVPLVVNQQRGFFLMAVAVVIIPVSIMVVLSTGKQYVAQANFSKAKATAASIEEFEKVATESFSLFPDDRFVSIQAQIHLVRLNEISQIESPTPEDEKLFLREAEKAKTAIDKAIKQDPTNPDNHAILAGIYSSLAAAGISEAQSRAIESLQTAKNLDPFNPGYYLIAAQMSARVGQIDKAREEIATALSLKSNFTEALFLSAQLDIGEGKVESAIEKTMSIISLEPQNQTRYFQLGMLFSANKQYDESIQAFKAAIEIDPQYANARYLLALTYIATEQPDLALTQLRVVAETNPDNQELLGLISKIESGETIVSPDLGFEVPLLDVTSESVPDEPVTTSGTVDTDLVNQLNPTTRSVDDSEFDNEEIAPEDIDEEQNDEAAAEETE